MKTSGNLDGKREQTKKTRRRKRGRPFTLWATLVVAIPLLTALVKLATEIVKLFST